MMMAMIGDDDDDDDDDDDVLYLYNRTIIPRYDKAQPLKNGWLLKVRINCRLLSFKSFIKTTVGE